ncbi:tyrosine-type recombinase/integrase [Microbacterium proteolyticum]|uniref:tyrosine-type recombinase/integrase n=1 Tax=Microbacterium proteolyticum TaxID=1572644 RepID=UPI001FAE2D08|nr:tyrosine-type recombinase/integrase [Microbacterium proteolyticum]MCI9856788.1 tyrosine-type recombinase/integrase [Microbacterium proteolyticum]
MKKNEASSVTYRVLPSGRVQVRYRLPNGEQVTHGTYDDRSTAERHGREIQVDLAKGVKWDDRKARTPFSVFMRDIYMPFRETKVAASTYLNNRTHLSKLIDYFGQIPLGRIDVEAVDTWWASLPESVARRNTYMFLTRAMRYAVRWQYIQTNPCQVEDAGKNVAKPRPKFTVGDIYAVLDHADDRTRTAALVAFSGHLRIGEVCGLNRADYDAAKGHLRIERQAANAGPVGLTDTKTGNRRTIKLLAPGQAALDEWIAAHPMLPTAPLFVGTKGGRINRVHLRDGWDAAKLAAGFPEFHFHDLKRVGLTAVARTGANVRDVMFRGGHRSYTAALSYLDASEDRDDELAALTNARLGRR